MSRLVYCAGMYTGLSPDTLHVIDYPYRLESFHYITTKVMEQVKSEGRRIFLDSGAFSAFTKGVQIDIKEYAGFIKQWSDQIEYASVLDGIGDPELTLTNQRRLEDMGVSVLPCFHYGEPISYLDKYLKEYAHITVGGMVPISTPQLHLWLDQIWHGPLDGWNGRVHGFGLTTISTMVQYPWYSVDSTVWIKAGRFGAIIVPKFNGLGLRIQMSTKSADIQKADKHFATLAKVEQVKIREMVEGKGFTIEGLSEDYKERDRWNIAAMEDLMQLPFTTRPKARGLFD